MNTGLERLITEKSLQHKVKGNIAYLCHGASIDSNYTHGLIHLKKIFGDRLKKVFGPQHGFVGDVQDNMIETDHFQHPYFKLPIYSLYSETRIPTKEMLEGIDTIIIDLQDVGTRVYTYISTMTLLMKECAKLDLLVIILDRPNPQGGETVEGNILESDFKSFVGLHPIPMRHGLTLGEYAKISNQFYQTTCTLEIIEMKGWKRSMFWRDTNLPWVNPSPNLPTADGSFIFSGTVLFEGTNISEGRGTTRSLEVIGHPTIEPFGLLDKINAEILKNELAGFTLRPIHFMPAFQKWEGLTCGGFQIHITDNKTFRPWRVGQILMNTLYKSLGDQFEWKKPPYEYEYEKMPIDLINGSNKIRNWIESSGDYSELLKLESIGKNKFLDERNHILLYS